MRIHRNFWAKACAARRQPLNTRMISSAAFRLNVPEKSSSSLLALAVLGVIALNADRPVTLNHCQVPCGIFDDPAMVGELKEACTTIRKAIAQSNALHGSVTTDPLSLNQMVRWINTKEEHCNKIISLVSEYCLCQRVKRPNFKSEDEYLQALKVHHTVMQAAMAAKQSMSESSCATLEHAVDDLSKMYTK